MKKLIWSAFAMSLCLISLTVCSQTDKMDEFLWVESKVLPDLKGTQRFTPPALHDKADWNVPGEELDLDVVPLKGQGYSLIPWNTQKTEEWLSIDKWIIERSLKDKVSDWQIRLRDDRQFEHVGKVLQCHGKCDVFRGRASASVEHLSRINEGDEFKTEANSVAWIYLIDGTLMRVGPSTSVSFQEVNWSKNEVFHLVRLHEGHIYWHPRDSKEFPIELSPETDAISLPLLVREANQGQFERELFQKQSDFARSEETVRLEDTAITSQIQKLNELRVKNNSHSPPVTRVMVVAPNVTLVGKLSSFDLLHYPGGKSYFKNRKALEGYELSVHLRGYSATEVTSVSEESWFEIETNGRSLSKVEQVSGGLEITELLTRRIKTIELAREIWLEKYTTPLVNALNAPKELALHHGYTLWGDELNKRFDFLVEYTRRMETTNLKSMDNLLKKLEANEEVQVKELGQSHYQTTLEFYLKDLKMRYTNQRTQVREMSDLQYYIWILRNGKRQN